MASTDLNLGHLNAKLDWQNQDFWLHIEASTNLNKYPAKQHARNVATKLRVNKGFILLTGEKTVLLKDSDQPVPFRQRRYFYYLSGCNEADCYVSYDIAKDELTLYIPEVDLRHAVWGGAGSTRAEAYAKYDVDVVKYTAELPSVLDGWHLQDRTAKLYLLEFSPTRFLSSRDQVKRLERIDTSELKSAIELCRVIKDPHEIQLIRRANEISGLAHRAVLERIGDFKNERQIEGIFLDTCISVGAHEQAYQVIAGSGQNAAVLHYVANNDPLEDRQLVLLDAGAEYGCYASDVTRTFPISGSWSNEARNIYNVVEEMQSQCIARIKPGVHFHDLQILAAAIATRSLLKLGILHNGSVQDILLAGTILAFFPHGLGHHVGLDVHDVLHVPIQSKECKKMGPADESMYKEPDLDGISPDALKHIYKVLLDPKISVGPSTIDSPVLQKDMVVTVEPGIYFSNFALSKVYLRDPKHAKFINKVILAKYLPVGGVRIEDDILVTKNGFENLTTAPKGEEALKIIRGEQQATAPERLTGQPPATVAPPCVSRNAPCNDQGKTPIRDLPEASIGVKNQASRSLESNKPMASDEPAVVEQQIGDSRSSGARAGISMPLYAQPGVSNTAEACRSDLQQLQSLREAAEAQQKFQVTINSRPAELLPPERALSSLPQRHAPPAPPPPASQESPQLAEALYDFDGEGDSSCLAFKKSDIVKVIEKETGGWWYGQNLTTQEKGWLPSNYVKLRSSHGTPAQPIAGGSGRQAPPKFETGPPLLPSNRALTDNVHKFMSEQRLRYVFSTELAALLDEVNKDKSSEPRVGQTVNLLDDPTGSLACFPGLCMQLKLLRPALDFGKLPGHRLEKFRIMYRKLDECLKAEFGPGHLFHAMNATEREELYVRRWEVVGIKEAASTEGMGICCACKICREGFAQWDEKWLVDDADEDEDDEQC